MTLGEHLQDGSGANHHGQDRSMKAADRLEAAVIAMEAAGHPFEKMEDIPWMGQIEQRFGRRLPATACALFASFAFPEIGVGGVTFFSNINDGPREDIIEDALGNLPK